VLPFPSRLSRWRIGRPAFFPSRVSIAVGLLLALLAGVAYVAARETAVFALQAIEVEGAPAGLEPEVRRTLAPLLGESLVALDGDEVVRRVEAIPAVRAATFDRSFPHTLVVTVVRERPAAILRRGKEAWLVSDRGRVIRPYEGGARGKGLARVWVPRAVAAAPGATLDHPPALRAVRALAAHAREGSPLRVTDVRAGPAELTFVLSSKLELRLGDLRALPLKLAVAAEIVPTLAPPAAGGPAYLDVSLPDRPVAGSNPQVED
jgi:cell division septal protein FtsQ